MDYLHFRLLKLEAGFTLVGLWDTLCAIININSGGRELLIGTSQEIASLEALIYRILIRLLSAVNANRSMADQLKATTTSVSGLLEAIDTRYGFISDERELVTLRHSIVEKYFDESKDTLKDYIGRMRRESGLFNKIIVLLQLKLKIPTIDDSELMRGVIATLPDDIKLQVNPKLSPLHPEYIINMNRFEAVLDALQPSIKASREYLKSAVAAAVRGMNLSGIPGTASNSGGGGSGADPNAFLAGSSRQSSNIICYNCQGVGHMGKDCPQPDRRLPRQDVQPERNTSSGNRNYNRGGDRGGFNSGPSRSEGVRNRPGAIFAADPKILTQISIRIGQRNGQHVVVIIWARRVVVIPMALRA